MQDGENGGRQRLFIALPCPFTPMLRSVLDALRPAVDAGVRPVDADTLHLTLKFLGSVAEERIPAVVAAMDAACANTPAFAIELAGAGSFKSALWLGVKAPPALVDLTQRCEAAMATLGFTLEKNLFRPHVTVARLKHKPAFDVQAWTEAYRGHAWGSFTAGAVHLYRSETLATGARYTVTHTVALRQGTSD